MQYCTTYKKLHFNVSCRCRTDTTMNFVHAIYKAHTKHLHIQMHASIVYCDRSGPPTCEVVHNNTLQHLAFCALSVVSVLLSHAMHTEYKIIPATLASATAVHNLPTLNFSSATSPNYTCATRSCLPHDALHSLSM